ncbi:MAG: hypothetical protein AAF519_15545, partial [Bacteroidota bacterium]
MPDIFLNNPLKNCQNYYIPLRRDGRRIEFVFFHTIKGLKVNRHFRCLLHYPKLYCTATIRLTLDGEYCKKIGLEVAVGYP